MATVEIDDDLWAEFCSLSERFEMPGPGDCLKWCLRRIIRFEEVADGRYVLVCCAVVTREVHAENMQEPARRGWVDDASGKIQITEVGKQVRAEVEAETERLFFAPWSCLNESELDELASLASQLRDGLKKGV